MGEITQFVKAACLTTVFTFFSFLLLSASNTAPTELIITEKSSKSTSVDLNVSTNEVLPDLKGRDLEPMNSDFSSLDQSTCSVTAPPDKTAETDNDGLDDCATTVDLGTPLVENCAGVPAKPYVDGIEIDPANYKFQVGPTVVTWRVGLAVASDEQLVTVIDNEFPVIAAPSPVVLNNDPGSCSATEVVLGNPVVSDNCSTSVTHDGPTSFPVGETTIIWTVSDGRNTATATQTVTVKDVEVPTINAPLDVTATTDTNSCTATVVDLGIPNTADNCTTKVTHNAPAFFPVGETTVTWSITDGTNTAIDTQTVFVSDTQLPTITAPANINATTDLNSCTTTVSLGTPVVDDNCGVLNVSNNAPNVFPAGTTTVTWTVTDNSNNIATATQTITVTDSQDPTITAPANINATTDLNSCTATVSLGTPVVDDNCGVQTVNNDAPNVFPPGSTTVTWTVTDNSNNIATATQTITVTDSQDPTITAPANINATTDLNSCTATVSLGTPVVDDNCGVLNVNNNAPNVFLPGTTTVTWTVTDNSNNIATATQTVTITDSQNPMITAPENVTVNMDLDACSATGVDLGIPVTGDNCTVQPATNDAPTSFPLGETIVTWTVLDNSGNKKIDTQIVTVTDSQAPTITAPGAITANTDSNSCTATVSLGTPVVDDNCGTPATRNDAPNLFPVGKTIITWTVEDASGNQDSATQIVTVTDIQVPTITAPAAMTVNTDLNSCSATGVDLGVPVTGDNCAVEPATNDAPTSFPLGTTTVTWTVYDNSGNKKTDTQIVTVTDSQAPTITAPGAITANTDPNSCTATVSLGTPFIDDNCGTPATRNDAPNLFPVGKTIVTWTVEDASGNQDSATQIVTVTDIRVPTITAPAAMTVNTDLNSCSATGVDLGVPVTGDNCAVQPATNDAPTSFPLGTTTVTWTVYDNSGNKKTDTQQITVTDNQLPTITAPANINAVTDLDSCTATVILGEPVTDDNCGVLNVSNNAPNVFPLGTTTVTWTVTDSSNNIATATQTVTITDSQNPMITAPGNVTVNTDPDACSATGVYLGIPVTGDNCAVQPATNDAPTSFPLGETIVTWTVLDNSGNSTKDTQTVTVTDAQAPTITAPAAITSAYTSDDGMGNCTSTVVMGTAITADNCGIAFVAALINGSPINPNTHLFPKGTTTVTWQVTDNAGNTASNLQNITVLDNEAPVIDAPSDVIAYTNEDGRGNCTTTASIGLPSISDNCNSVSRKAFVGGQEINPAVHEFPLGTTVVTWIASDDSGNTSSAVQNVIINDNEAPIPPDMSTIVMGCAFTVPLPVASDNCNGSVAVTANRSTTFSSSGTIIWTFTDEAGNSDSASQSIIIDPLSASLDSVRTSVYGRNDGILTANPSGGNAPYTFEWRQVGNPQVISTARQAMNLAAGKYEVTITDVSGCSLTATGTVISAVNPAIISSSECLSVHDYIRTSSFQVDLDNISGGVGDPANYSYQWNFGPGATPSTASGTDEITVEWDYEGDKVIELVITDQSNYSQVYEIAHYVGGCFEGCGTSTNFDLDTTNFFIGDKDGKKLMGANCEKTTEKYLWIDITKNANGYSLSAELNYAVNNGEETISRKAIGCFAEIDDPTIPTYKPIPQGLFRLFPIQESGYSSDKITWKCGESFTVLQMNIRWTNQNTRGCNEGTKPMCYGPAEEIIISTPLMAEATPTHVLCKGEATGSVSVRAAGGDSPFSYSLAGPVNRVYQESNVFYNLPAGQYTFSVKDMKEVITSGTVIITEPATNISATVDITTPINCYGGTGAATVVPAGGTSPYSYSWSSGATAEVATGLLADITYTVTVTDANNCYITQEVMLTQPVQLTRANAGIDQTSGCGITTTNLSANTPAAGEQGQWRIVSGTNGNLAATDISDPNAAFSGVSGQTYVLEWTISNSNDSCLNSDQVTITFTGECSTLDFDGIDDYVIVGDQYDLDNTDFSLGAWVRPKSVNGSKTILSKRNTGDMASGGYDLSIINGAVTFRWNNNEVYTTHKIGTDRWYHVAVIFTQGVPEVFVDGISLPLQWSVSVSGNPKATSYPFMIGAANYIHTPTRPKNNFHGWIEEVRIWNTALTVGQLRFMMNQRLRQGISGGVKGEILPMEVPGGLLWSQLMGYYRLMVTEIDVINGTTPDGAADKALGNLINIEETQENSAPLPYVSNIDGNWWNDVSWLRPDYWDPPNSTGLNGEKINWNIAYVTHELNSGNMDITLLGLLLKAGAKEGKLNMLGTNPTNVSQTGTGNGLTITQYLELDGYIDLNGESQLVQPEGSILTGSGRLDRDQQGTASSYNYNYFSSPVSTGGVNAGYSIAGVLRSGTDPATPSPIDFNYQYHYADGPRSSPLKISSYWLFKFHGIAGEYSEWHWIGENGTLSTGEGFTMKGTSGYLGILDLQNYVFSGMPNNGPVSLIIGQNENRLVGNPYPSAIDADEFIKDNLADRRGENVFNGSLYFWSHFSGQTHYLSRYIGGYATYNLAGGVRAVSNDARINATGESGGMIPQQYIPPGQAFFINTEVDESNTTSTMKFPNPVGITGGEVHFSNSQRIFQKEEAGRAVFHSVENTYDEETTKRGLQEEQTTEERKKIWIRSVSPQGYHRQLLLTADKETTLGFDLGYDAPLYDQIDEDMFWQIEQSELVIQGIPDFHKEVELPLSLKIKEEGQFIIGIDKLQNIPDDFAILLKDSETGQTHNLQRSDFRYMAEPGRVQGRFSIVFLNSQKDPEELPEEAQDLYNIELYYTQNEEVINIINPDLVVLKKAYLYNLNGQLLSTYDYVPTESLVKLKTSLRISGVYVLRLVTEKGTRSIKFISD